ncbi:hypothetical protein DTW90_25545 [Neorhizobium sp. P12A]|nr:hypothetical protein DTW90_25545 [Neorhizobium sp. P12A]
MLTFSSARRCAQHVDSLVQLEQMRRIRDCLAHQFLEIGVAPNCVGVLNRPPARRLDLNHELAV